jgi:DNA-binding response OmpR family regulator
MDDQLFSSLEQLGRNVPFFVSGANMPGLGTNHKVLIVDDEKTICSTLAVIFMSHGYEVRSAYSAERAAEVIAEWQPDLAILDVGLPKMNGIDFAIALKAIRPTCRTLLFSGRPDTNDLLEKAAQDGYLFEILAKPIHPTILLDAAKNLTPTNSDETLENPPKLS